MLAVAVIVFAACSPTVALTQPATTVPPIATQRLATAAGQSSAAPPTTAPPAAATPAPTANEPRSVPSISVSLQLFAKVPGQPLSIVAPDDGSGRLFVVSQDGRIWVVRRDGSVLPDPLLDLRNRISTGGERGLLGLALHPGFPADPRLYVDDTNTNGDTEVSVVTMDPSNGNRADPSTLQRLLLVKQPYPNHNGGALQFGPDGDLYVSLGDGGSGGDPQGNGQNTNALLGKILRLDVDHAPAGQGYAIPAGNPFASGGGAPEVWLYGLRNPWRMSFDQATGDLWIGDVGQNLYEEVDVDRAGVGGLNYGWNTLEATHCYNAQRCSTTGMTPPVAEYGHDIGTTVIGGYVYRGSATPIADGVYLFADYGSGRLFAIGSGVTRTVAPTQVGQGDTGVIAGFGEDPSGELYVASLDGKVSRLVIAAK